MRRLISSISSNGFVKDFARLFGGGAAAQIINFAFIAVISRLYSDIELGVFAIFIATANIIGSTATGKYDQAIMLPKQEKKARNLFLLSLFSTLWTSVVVFCAIVIFVLIANIAGYSIEHRVLLWFLPAAILINGTVNTIQSYLNRIGDYGRLANAQLASSTTTNLLRTPRIIYPTGIFGLAFSYFSAQLASIVILSKKHWRKWRHLIRHSKINKLPSEAKEYNRFPRYSMPMNLLNLVSVNLLLLSIGFIWGSALSGQYERAFKLVYIPLEMVGAAFSTIFYQRFTLSKQKVKMYITSLTITLAGATIILLPFIFLGQSITTFVLGANWGSAGIITGLLAPMAIFNFGTRCVSMAFASIGKNRELLIWQAAFLAIMASWVVIGRSQNFYTFIAYYAAIAGTLYFLLALLGLYFVKNHKAEE